MEKLLAITAIGPDRTGLVRDLSEVVTGAGVSIRESSMMSLGSEFAVLMLVAGSWHALGKLKERLGKLERSADLSLTLRDAEQRQPGQSAPYSVDVVSLDRDGIVLALSGFFAGRGLEIAEMNSRSYNAAHTGAAMFEVQMTINLPAEVHTASLREDFLDFCDAENLDGVFEPAQR